MLKLIIILALALISIQDFRERMVYWVIFPFLVVLLIFNRISLKESVNDIFFASLINISFIIIQLLLVSTYFSIKNKQFVNILTGLLGLGDVLFLIAVASYLSVLNFIFFYIASLILSLLFWIVWKKLVHPSEKHIPLAGIQAVLFAMVLIFDWWLLHIDITKDDWLTSFFYKWT
jgi:hypothetical protein